MPKGKKKCGLPCDVYSRVVGYYMPVSNWNVGKQAEFKDRKVYKPEQAAKNKKSK